MAATSQLNGGAYPPTVHHSERRISTDDARAFIDAFLIASRDDASLHPTAVLTEQGPVATDTAGTTSLALHHLERVAKGLAGERLGVDTMKFGGSGGIMGVGDESGIEEGTTMAVVEDEELGGELENGAGDADEENEYDGRNGNAGGEEVAEGAAVQSTGKKQEKQLFDWQELSDFEREQEIVSGDVGQENTAAATETKKVPKVKNAEETEVDKDREKRQAKKTKKKRKAEEVQESVAPTPYGKKAEKRKRVKESQSTPISKHGPASKQHEPSSNGKKVDKKKHRDSERGTPAVKSVAAPPTNDVQPASTSQQVDRDTRKEEKKARREAAKKQKEAKRQSGAADG